MNKEPNHNRLCADRAHWRSRKQAQLQLNKQHQHRPRRRRPSTTYEAGTVSTYTPGKTIVVKSEHEGPVSFALGTAARIVNGAGKIVTAPLRAGQKVRVYYTGTGDTRVVERVQVEE